MVGNLAERAAEKVAADPLLVRVGAYYHDVGKLVRPYFFIENQFDGKNAHDTLDPQTSARIVATHVRDGLELAARYKLPPRVQEFISEHHGTRLVGFFYHQASQEGDGQVDASQYSYPGPKPRSKEAGIVMLADSVEAVVRSAKDHSPENVSALVRKVVDERVGEGQLDDCDLTIRDIERIKTAFIEILMGMYHPRIEYPSTLPEPDGQDEAVERESGHAGQAAS
jgi:putative nucleotidyltransferase with HDIG domain